MSRSLANKSLKNWWLRYANSGMGTQQQSGAVDTVESLTLALPGIIALWKMDETSGTDVNQYVTTSGIANGTYASSPPLAVEPLPPGIGGGAADYTATGDEVLLVNAALQAQFNKDVGWMSIWVKYTKLTNHQFLNIDNGGNTIFLNIGAPGVNATYARIIVPYTNLAYMHNDSDWVHFVLSWEEDVSAQMYVQGARVANDLSWTGAPGIGMTALYCPRINGFGGNVAWLAVGAGAIPTDVQIDAIWQLSYPDSTSIFACGDSKATDNDDWIVWLTTMMGTELSLKPRESPFRIGLSGKKVSDLHTELDSVLPTIVGTPDNIFMNIGSNDISGGTAETPFKVGLRGCIDALRAKWPAAEIYIAQPYRDDAGDGAYDVASDAIKVWILAVIAEYGSNVFAGQDETGWFKTGLATYSDDGIHPNAAGHVEAANQWLAAYQAAHA